VRATGQQHTIRAITVDDEPLALENLRVLLARDPQIQLVAECTSGRGALKAIRASRPELVFLDVQMPECDGFDVWEQLGTLTPAALVFVTAYDQYALRAFEAGAIDYLLKPFDTERFELALARAKARIAKASDAPAAVERWAIKTAGRVLFVRIADIDWIESADYYVELHVGTRNHLLRRSMADVAHELERASFCRIHRTAIVNLQRVLALEPHADGGTEVVLTTGERLSVSRRYRRQLQLRMGVDDG
jgi:two-component system LytT family response regulator